MALHSLGFRAERLSAQPNGYPPIGYEFQKVWPPIGAYCSSYGTRKIDTFRVIGWEKQVDANGEERISVRAEHLGGIEQRPRAMLIATCNLGHVHDVFEYSEEIPPGNKEPEIWGLS